MIFLWREGFRVRAQSASGTAVDAIPRRRRSGHPADPGDAASQGSDPSQAHPGRKQYRPVVIAFAGRSRFASRNSTAAFVEHSRGIDEHSHGMIEAMTRTWHHAAKTANAAPRRMTHCSGAAKG